MGVAQDGAEPTGVGDWTREDVLRAFEAVDTDGGGTLDREEVRELPVCLVCLLLCGCTNNLRCQVRQLAESLGQAVTEEGARLPCPFSPRTVTSHRKEFAPCVQRWAR